MKTADLVAMLAADVAPVPANGATRRIGLALLPGIVLGLVWMLAAFGLRPDLAQAVAGAGFWFKLALPLSLAAAGFVLARRLARPGVAAGAGWWGVLLPVAVVWAVALATLVQAPAAERVPLVMGETWRSCALNIAALSLPMFVAALLAVKSMAPTRPALAGAAAGVLAGGVGAAVYALHCPEVEAPFLAVWYLAGMALPVVVGAVAGPRLLRW